MRKRRTFSREFKREAATMVLDQGHPWRTSVYSLMSRTVYGAGFNKFSLSVMVAFPRPRL